MDVLKVLCEHAHSSNTALRVNAIWALKHLVAHQEWQTKLRNTLREQFDSTSPTGLQISKTITPELDATVEEALRVGSTAPFLFRRTKEDTNILGHHVPANTDILMLVS